MSRLGLLWINITACVISVGCVLFLLAKIPDGVIPHPDKYRDEIVDRIENEQEISVLKQLSRFKFTYLLTVNQVSSWMVFSSLAVTGMNCIALALNCWAMRPQVAKQNERPEL
jgi:hypothetical protein